jgi:hypothetical protein
MSFWDSSALLPLLCTESQSARMRELYAVDDELVVWAFTPVEIASALNRRARDGTLSRKQLDEARSRIRKLEDEWSENVDYENVRTLAQRMLEVHALSAADALQLAAAVVTVGERRRFGFVTLDRKLADAAAREGFLIQGVHG